MNWLVECFGWSDERFLGKVFCFIIGGKEMLNKEGKWVWLNVGDEVSFVLMNVICVVEVVVC